MDIKFPKISIVTVCYNHKQYIADTIESIISQGYPNLEYVVIDDGSTDGSWDVIQQYKDKITYCERMEGYRDTPTIALNYGFKKTTGDIMGWISSDDILLPKSLFVIGHFFSHQPKEVSWITGMATTINARSEIVNSKLRLKHRYDYLLGDWKIIQQESTFWRKELWEDVGGKLEGEKKWAFDTELWTRFFHYTKHYHLETPLGAFRVGKQSKSVSDNDLFLTPNHFYLERFQNNVTVIEKAFAIFYKILKSLYPLFMWIPHSMYMRMPLLKRYMYRVFVYSTQEDMWQLEYRNPFRK